MLTSFTGEEVPREGIGGSNWAPRPGPTMLTGGAGEIPRSGPSLGMTMLVASSAWAHEAGAALASRCGGTRLSGWARSPAMVVGWTALLTGVGTERSLGSRCSLGPAIRVGSAYWARAGGMLWRQR